VPERQHARQQPRLPGGARGGIQRLAHARNLRSRRHDDMRASGYRAAVIQEIPRRRGSLIEKGRPGRKRESGHG
jgi:hypothetical protein